MVADHRAPTPSAAIEHIVPDQDEIFARLDGFDVWLRTTIQNQLNGHDTRIQELETRLAPTQRKDAIYQLYQTVDTLDAACRNSSEDVTSPMVKTDFTPSPNGLTL